MKAYSVFWCATGKQPRICCFEDNNEDRALAVYGSRRRAEAVMRAGGPIECSNGVYRVMQVNVEVVR